MRRIHDTNLVFVHIPKTAGMAVTEAFSLVHRPSDHTMLSESDRLLMAPNFIRFCVIRNPYSRFVSAYRYSINMVKHSNGHSVRKEIIEHGLGGDVNEFLIHYRSRPDDLLSNIHFAPQVKWVINCDPHIFLRQERLATDIEVVRQYASIHYRGLKKINTSTPSNHGKINLTLTPRSKQLLDQIYASDFKLLNRAPL